MQSTLKARFVGLVALVAALGAAADAKATCGPPECRLTALGAGCAPAVATGSAVPLQPNEAIRVSTLCRMSCSAPGGPGSIITADPTANASVTREGASVEARTRWTSERCGAELVGIIEPASGTWDPGLHDVALGTSPPTTFDVPDSSTTGCTASRMPHDPSHSRMASAIELASAVALALAVMSRRRRTAQAQRIERTSPRR